MKDPLDEALGLPPMPREKADLIVPEPIGADDDYEFARKNMYALAQKAEAAIDQLSEIAEISQHPRAFEVLSNLIGTAIGANKDLLALRKIKQETASGESGGGPQTINNNLIMTSDDVLKMIKGHTT